MTSLESFASEVAPALSDRLGKQIASVQPISGGRNSRVFRIECHGLDRYIAKIYPAAGPGQGDRLEAEFSGLSFLWDNGLRCVPQPLVADIQRSWAVYEYIDGAPVPPGEVSESDIQQAVAFLLRLKDLRNNDGSSVIGPAAEACLPVQVVLDSIDLRLERLESLQSEGPQYSELERFLETEFHPAWAETRHRVQSELGASLVTEVGSEERTLSPSDFGFHNALRRPNGQLVFLDFEYFGWDDPAKMISDFLLHPGMALTDALKWAFRSGILKGFQDLPRLEDRVNLLYPLFALKWCLILLNEFVPERMQRRSFADGQSDTGQLLSSQLEKARTMLGKVALKHDVAT